MNMTSKPLKTTEKKKIESVETWNKVVDHLQPVMAVFFGMGLGLIVTWMVGEAPWHVMEILYKSAFGSWYDFGMTLFYTTSLIFAGFSVMLAFHAGLFNVGAEGQLMIGALSAAAVGIVFPQVPWPYAPCLATLAAFLGGGTWAAVAGALRAWRGCHEVITTIMLNFIAAGISNWVTLYVLRNPLSQNPETKEIGKSYWVQQFALFQGAPVSTALVIGLVVAVLIWIFLWHTRLGFELRACGQNEHAAETAGINVPKTYFLALCLSGGVAGLVGVAEILGNSGKFKMGFSPGIGFMGIAVALLGRSRPLGVLISAFLFGALHKGTVDLDFETEHISRELSLILQALVILSVTATGFWNLLKKGKLRSKS